VGNFLHIGLPSPQQKQLALGCGISTGKSRSRWEKQVGVRIVWFGFCFCNAKAGCRSQTKRTLINARPSCSEQCSPLAQLLEELHMTLCQRDIFPAASSMKHLVKLFPAYTGEEKLEIVDSLSFFRRSKFRQIILKTDSPSPEKLLHQRSRFRSHFRRS
jgi:hypothetical protein